MSYGNRRVYGRSLIDSNNHVGLYKIYSLVQLVLLPVSIIFVR